MHIPVLPTAILTMHFPEVCCWAVSAHSQYTASGALSDSDHSQPIFVPLGVFDFMWGEVGSLQKLLKILVFSCDVV